MAYRHVGGLSTVLAHERTKGTVRAECRADRTLWGDKVAVARSHQSYAYLTGSNGMLHLGGRRGGEAKRGSVPAELAQALPQCVVARYPRCGG